MVNAEHSTTDGKTEQELDAHAREMFRKAREEMTAALAELDAAGVPS
jgi:hypothetical protein